jgi:hypothetical protein
VASYDEVFSDFQVKLMSAVGVIAKHPEVKQELLEAVSSRADGVEVGNPADEARANALAALIRDVTSALGQ